MADRYLLESGAPDGYQLEDGSGVILLETSNSHIQDDGEGWSFTAGVVGRVLAGAALALSATVAIANGFKHQDETPVAPGTTSSESSSSFTQRATQTTTFIRWAQPDEAPFVAATPLPVEENEAGPLPPRPPYPVVRIWQEADERPTPAAAFIPTEADPPVLTSAQAPLTLRTWNEQDEIPTPAAAFTPMEDDPPLLTPPPAPSVNGIIWASDNDGAFPIGFEDDAWAPTIFKALIYQARPWVEDDFIGVAVTFKPDEDIWLRLATIPAQPIPTVWTDQDDLPTPAAAFTPTEEDWAAPFTVAARPVLALWAGEDEWPTPAAAPTIVEDEGWIRPAVPAVPPVLAVWTDQDERAPTAFEDDSWQAYVPPAAAPRTLYLPDAEDSALTPPAALAPDEDFWLAPPPITVLPTVTVWNQPDDWLPPPPPGTFEDDSWQVYTPPWPTPCPPFVGDNEDVPELVAPPVVDEVESKPHKTPKPKDVRTLDEQEYELFYLIMAIAASELLD